MKHICEWLIKEVVVLVPAYSCGRFSVDEEPNPTICRAAHAGLDILPDRSESAAPPPDFSQVTLFKNRL